MTARLASFRVGRLLSRSDCRGVGTLLARGFFRGVDLEQQTASWGRHSLTAPEVYNTHPAADPEQTGPYLGLRPCEWLNANVVVNTLQISTAKRGNGDSINDVRSIQLTSLPPNVVKLVSGLIDELRLLFAESNKSWRRILGRLGERLARVCARIGIRRWSLYTIRHVAVASWKKAGLSNGEIAALAGHSSTRTARQHYAGGRHGWKADFACARLDPALLQ